MTIKLPSVLSLDLKKKSFEKLAFYKMWIKKKPATFMTKSLYERVTDIEIFNQ